MRDFSPPSSLITSILNGRCIAFVGAGFAAMVMPSWDGLLQQLATKLSFDLPVQPQGNAFYYEALGQQLRDAAGDRWEELVHEVLQEKVDRASPDRMATLLRRKELLMQIPFKAILTTNFDPSLETSHQALGPAAYAEVLREEHGRWWVLGSKPVYVNNGTVERAT